MGFRVVPAIDLRGGRCVRLTQGDYDRETVFADNPAEVAARWTAAGARVIHVVDLDGAASGLPANLPALRAIRAATGVTIQYGGGLRDDATIDQVLEAGADRIVLGTALVTRPDWVASLCTRMGERIVIGIDARDGVVATQGWRDASTLTTRDAIARAAELGVQRALFTDIGRDGMLGGPNLAALREVVAAAPFEVIASGGVATIADLEAIQQTGAAAAIVGRALYTGAVDLGAAIARLEAQET
ncbi:MAG: phosphoribosylformimino-5-aminoimidazole carboxamide ribotide isomerase [Chloroflexota bacterium]|jgi:phosphoribosylformimino-5-aminoimidazole carboxamide ribotide isomerase|nr:phosphoribosylformimino-5-aminoimidazole carboxamide ribotide isomerase [Chloroflexota bacterium]